MKFLVDNQLPTALSAYLVSRGLDCQHVTDVGLTEASDIEVWRYAGANDRIIISKDEDFFHLAGKPGPGARLIWVRLGNCRTHALLAAMERMWPRIEERLREGERVVELRRGVWRGFQDA